MACPVCKGERMVDSEAGMIPCGACEGSGAGYDPSACSYCGGSGSVNSPADSGKYPCPQCGGTRRANAYQTVCDRCGGSGTRTLPNGATVTCNKCGGSRTMWR